ncbi:MAG: restriction endonuclease subunit S [Blastocatellales bacterium]
MSNFCQVKLGDVLTFQRGFDITKNEQLEGNVPIVSSSGITSYHNKWKQQKPGVVIGRKGTLGTVHYISINYWPHDTTLWVKDFKGNDPRFLCYFLQTLHLENFDTGASNPTLNRNHLHKIKVRFPKAPIQRKIAAILSAYDDLIENNQRRIALLERMAEEIYREWFVRMRFPGHEQVKFEKGVPEGWEIKRLGEVIELCYGKALKEDERVPGEFPVYGSSGVVGTHNKPLVAGPGIVVGRKGNVGSVHWTDRDFYPIDTAYYVKSNISGYYLFFLLHSMNFINNDAAVPGLNRNQAYSNKFFLPEKRLILEFSRVTEYLFTMKQKLTKKNEMLRATRDMLLSRLISGTLSVENLDIQFPPRMLNDAATEARAE